MNVQWKDPAFHLTISNKLQESKVNSSLPRRPFLESNPIACGGKDVPAADGHKFASFIPTSFVIQHRCIVDESIQLPEIKHPH